MEDLKASLTATPERVWDPRTWTWAQLVACWAVHLLLLEVLQNGIIMNFGRCTSRRIVKGGHHLDELETLDKACIVFNRMCVPVLTLALFSFCYTHPEHVEWDPAKATPLNTVGSYVAFFLVYDLVYAPFHRLLHVKSLYWLIHKHHHRQHAPSRGNLDAVNVHPFEFISGEMIHLLCVAVVPCHLYAVVAFLATGGVLASLNHTRFDITLPGVYDVKAHDVHHRLPRSNYGQYTMWMDRVMGSYRPYTKPGSASAASPPAAQGGAQGGADADADDADADDEGDAVVIDVKKVE